MRHPRVGALRQSSPTMRTRSMEDNSGQVSTWLKANPRRMRTDRMERTCDMLALGLIRMSCPGSRQMEGTQGQPIFPSS